MNPEKDWDAINETAIAVSVPLRGSGYESGCQNILGNPPISNVSVPLRGSGYESCPVFVTA